jgi:hypothetical protein
LDGEADRRAASVAAGNFAECVYNKRRVDLIRGQIFMVRKFGPVVAFGD